LIGGAVIPIVAQMISNGGGLAYAGLLLSVAGLLTFLAVMISGYLQRRGISSVVQEPAMHRA
jgi:fucose permease